ncbi:MAG: rubredoxin [Methanosarcina flavescens]|uniref:rubredoxin n=1 Tax=Methanosarcina flavescens TaxID=1715806 RepID=UPI001D04FAC3|nr:rubredoxin [Methanosarcina flavescens]
MIHQKRVVRMYRCSNCGYLYNPHRGDSSQSIAPDTPFQNLPKSWKCPRCGAPKEKFKEI